jgi:hypothetical protein
LIGPADQTERTALLTVGAAWMGIRMGKVDGMDEDRVRLMSAGQMIVGESARLVLESPEDSVFRDQLSDLKQALLLVGNAF